MTQKTPTIKGIFVNAHVRALKEQKGDRAVQQLQQLFGKPLHFKNLEDVPVIEEVKIVDNIVDILYGDALPRQKRAFEAGRLHFRNFLTTSVAKILFAQSRFNAKLTFLWAHTIAAHIFKGVVFESEDVGKHTVKITIENSDYPLEHFQGFLQEWVNQLGLIGSVTAEEVGLRTYEYLVDWH